MDHLSIVFLKEGVSEEEIREPSHVPQGHSDRHRWRGRNRVHARRPSATAGVEAFFGNLLDPAALGLMAASASALLVVPIKNRTFAITSAER